MIRDNIASKRPPLYHKELIYQVYAEMNSQNPAKGNCIFPQIEYLEEIHEYYPNATFILNTRNVDHWIHSVENWSNMMSRLKLCNITGFPAGVGGPNATRQFFLHHIKRIHQFVEIFPSHNLIEVDIESKEAENIMANTFGANETCWGQSNARATKQMIM